MTYPYDMAYAAELGATYIAAALPEKGRRARVIGLYSQHASLWRPHTLFAGGTVDHPKRYFDIPEKVQSADPSLHVALQDLADQITWDLTQACAALDDPDLDYWGVDNEVSDAHVALVMWATQRELDRELRLPTHVPWTMGAQKRPSVPLAELPPRIQRAFVERRRLRYAQWGITQQSWENNLWLVEQVPEDPEWAPEWDPSSNSLARV